MSSRILHVISGLGVGGAELNLKTLVTGLDSEFDQLVMDLGAGGPVADQLDSAGIPVISLNLRGAPIAGLRRFIRVVQEQQPDLLQGWMYRGNLLASVAARLTSWRALLPSWLGGRAVPVLWAIRHHLGAWAVESRATRALIRVGGWPIWQPVQVLYNAKTAQQAHASFGYSRHAGDLLPNALDIERFQPDAERGRRHREQLHQLYGVDPDQPIIGLVGRYHDLKNVPLFLAIAAQVRAAKPYAQFVLAGTGMDSANSVLAAAIAEHQLEEHIHLLGPLSEPADLYCALDVLLSTSLSEATSNVILEALACGCPVVATNVGDAVHILPDELLVPARAIAVDDQVRQFQSRIGSLFADPIAATALVERARLMLTQEHDSAQVTEKLAAVYRRILGGKAEVVR